MYNLLLSISTTLPLAVAQQFPVWFTLVYLAGFIAAVTIGSLAWYNSKRPAGWEDAERPDYVPELNPLEGETNTEENQSS